MNPERMQQLAEAVAENEDESNDIQVALNRLTAFAHDMDQCDVGVQASAKALAVFLADLSFDCAPSPLHATRLVLVALDGRLVEAVEEFDALAKETGEERNG
jgi:hypothetical protein